MIHSRSVFKFHNAISGIYYSQDSLHFTKCYIRELNESGYFFQKLPRVFNERETAIIPCLVSGSPIPDISWFRFFTINPLSYFTFFLFASHTFLFRISYYSLSHLILFSFVFHTILFRISNFSISYFILFSFAFHTILVRVSYFPLSYFSVFSFILMLFSSLSYHSFSNAVSLIHDR